MYHARDEGRGQDRGTRNMDELTQIKKDWDDLAEINATWFNTPSEHLADDLTAFFQSGKSHLKNELELIRSLDIALGRHVALDFGCGVGRISQALAEEFEQCYGVDISDGMIETARRHNRFGDRCRYLVNPRPDIRIFEDDHFDFVFSTNVLQHNPPDVIRTYISEFIRILRPNGVLVFQLPIQMLAADSGPTSAVKVSKFHPGKLRPGYLLHKLRGLLIGYDNVAGYYRLRKLGLSKKWLYRMFGMRPNIDMNWLEEGVVRTLLEEGGCSIGKVRKYQHEQMVHADFLAVKLA